MGLDSSTQLDVNDVVAALQARCEQLGRDVVVRDAMIAQLERERDEARAVAATLTEHLNAAASSAEPAPAAKKAPAKKAPQRKRE